MDGVIELRPVVPPDVARRRYMELRSRPERVLVLRVLILAIARGYPLRGATIAAGKRYAWRSALDVQGGGEAESDG